MVLSYHLLPAETTGQLQPLRLIAGTIILEADFKIPYGALYNWYAVNTGKLCPTGWHVPTADEFTILLANLGGDQSAGGKLKEVGITHWLTPNLGASNTSGFTALPGGGRYNVHSDGGVFADLGLFNYMWSAHRLPVITLPIALK